MRACTCCQVPGSVCMSLKLQSQYCKGTACDLQTRQPMGACAAKGGAFYHTQRGFHAQPRLKSTPSGRELSFSGLLPALLLCVRPISSSILMRVTLLLTLLILSSCSQQWGRELSSA